MPKKTKDANAQHIDVTCNGCRTQFWESSVGSYVHTVGPLAQLPNLKIFVALRAFQSAFCVWIISFARALV